MKHSRPDRSTMQEPRFRQGPPVLCGLTWGNASRSIPRISRDQRQIAAVGCIWLRSATNARREIGGHKPSSEPVFRGRAEGVGFEPTRNVTTPNGFQDPGWP
jgi:hypothetical protein